MTTINRQTDTQTVKRYIGRQVEARIHERSNETVYGIFIGFWNPNFADKNSQIEPCDVPIFFPFNILVAEKMRIAVDSFRVID